MAQTHPNNHRWLFWDATGLRYYDAQRKRHALDRELGDLEREIAALNEEIRSSKHLIYAYTQDIDNLQQHGGLYDCCWGNFRYYGDPVIRQNEIARCQHCMQMTWRDTLEKQCRIAFLETIEFRLCFITSSAAPPPPAASCLC